MDIPRIHAFFGRFNVPVPSDPLEYPLFVQEQKDNWDQVLTSFQKVRKEWAREWLKLDALSSAREPNRKAIEAQESLVKLFRGYFKAAERTMLEARAREEVARVFVEASAGDEELQRFLEVQLQCAESYITWR